MQKSLSQVSLHLWFPNLFEFKGGIQVYLFDLLQALLEEFPESSIRVHDKLDQPQSLALHHQVTYSFYGGTPGFLRTFHFALGLAITSLWQRPDLILCCHLNFAPVAYLLHRLTKTPYWILVYGVDAWNLESRLKRKALKSAKSIISISDYTRRRLIQEQALDPKQISLLPVTFDASRFTISPKPQHLLKRYGLTVEQPIILTVSRLDSREPYKGYDPILRALPAIRKQIPDIHYVLVGKGSDRPRVEQLISQLNLQSSVTLAGFIPDQDLGDYYNLCDVFAMAGKSEGFGIVYLEALACGKPTLGGNQDGAVDALCNGELGALVNPNDIDEIAQTLIQILKRTYRHPIMYQPGTLRQRVIDVYGFDCFKQRLSELVGSYLQGTHL